MSLANPVFEKNYSYYLEEITKVDFGAVKDTLGVSRGWRSNGDSVFWQGISRIATRH